MVEDRLAGAQRLNDDVAAAVVAGVDAVPSVPDILAIEVEAPHSEPAPSRLYESTTARDSRPRRNFLEAEARNQSLVALRLLRPAGRSSGHLDNQRK